MKMLHTIENEDWLAKIDLAHGANCVVLRNKKHTAALLRELPDDGIPDNPYLYGMPILFPVNRIEGGTFEFEGRKYSFPINEPRTGCHLHGELHRQPFALTAQSTSRVQYRFCAAAGGYLGFPHAFEILQEYVLQSDGFYHTVTVRNLSQQNMPVFLGFHTTFQTLLTQGSRPQDVSVFADICEEYERNMEVNYLPTGRILPFDAVSTALAKGDFKPFAEKISRHYRGRGRMTITDAKKGIRVVYEPDQKYGFRLIFNGGDEGYICLEPQTCLANCQNAPFERMESGFDFLRVGESRSYRSKIYLEEL